MIFRPLFAALLALAMALAPLGMPAMAEAAPASHHGDMAGPGHCDQQPQPDRQPQPERQQSAADKSCCAAMCIAVIVPSGASDLSSYLPVRERPASDLGRRGFLDEVATPPPRLA